MVDAVTAPSWSEAFEPKVLRVGAEAAAERLEAHLAGRAPARVLDLTEPDELMRQARALMALEGEGVTGFDGERLAGIIDLYVSKGIQLYSPGAMGRQFSGVVPLAGVIEFVTSVATQPASFYEAGQLPNVAERIMGEEFSRFLGWQPGRMALVTTSGGSLGNLTALLAARNRRFPGFWSRGGARLGREGRLAAIAVGEEVHYGVSRAAGILGIGQDQVVRLPLNRRRQIDPERAAERLRAAERAGLEVFCLVASAGTTAVGAFDPLDELAALAAANDIWLHVDGAHGASVLVSDSLRGKLRGVDRVDSLVWDAHKLMFMPPPCTMLLYRDKDSAQAAFQQQASYVFDAHPDVYAEYDSGGRNFECTKRPMIMSLWAVWAMHGRRLFAERIEHVCEVTRGAYELVHEHPDFETLHEPEANILCFRFRPPGLEHGRVHRLQELIRNQIRRDGEFFISKVDVDGVAALRVVVMNPETTTAHFNSLLTEIGRVGRAVLSGSAAGQGPEPTTRKDQL
jgi:L-2,4-diaminobutyrate decarboxylase